MYPSPILPISNQQSPQFGVLASVRGWVRDRFYHLECDVRDALARIADGAPFGVLKPEIINQLRTDVEQGVRFPKDTGLSVSGYRIKYHYRKHPPEVRFARDNVLVTPPDRRLQYSLLIELPEGDLTADINMRDGSLASHTFLNDFLIADEGYDCLMRNALQAVGEQKWHGMRWATE